MGVESLRTRQGLVGRQTSRYLDRHDPATALVLPATRLTHTLVPPHHPFG